MKQLVNQWLITLLLVLAVLITMSEKVVSQPTDRNSTLMNYNCNGWKGLNPQYMLSNINTTLSNLRLQLTTTSGNAMAHTLLNGASVWGLAWCRGYLSVPDCLDCFDYAVDQLKLCGIDIGAHAIYSDCAVRYESYNFFAEADSMLYTVCANTTVPQPREFKKATKRLLLDLQIATPRAVNYYAASARKVVGNSTVYAIAQCNLDVNKKLCLRCLKSRSRSLYDCLPSTSGRAMGNQCFMRYDRTPFFGTYQETNITSLLADAYKGHSSKRSIIGVVVGGVSISLLVLAFFLWRCTWKKRNRGQKDTEAVYYNYRHLKLATNNFSEDNIIGKGGFGEVFKTILDDKKVVAVKKLKVGYAGAKVRFENEILLISQIHHRNLLGLLGWSSEGSDLLLVLEYIPNGSLDKFLWGAKRGSLNWKTRYDIILGIARGLAHLHKEFHVRIIHRDIKSSNILLDDDFQPKIADFGLARFQPEDRSHITTKFSGTLGYTAPEYILFGHLSDKVDTFSFGVVILEIISGRKCTYRSFDPSSTDGLLEYAWKLYETKNLIKLVDETMDANEYKEEQVINIIEIALLCTQSPVSKRPTMSEVVLMFQNDSSSGERRLTRPKCIDHDWQIQIGSS